MLDHQIKVLRIYNQAFGDPIRIYKVVGVFLENTGPTVMCKDVLAGKQII